MGYRPKWRLPLMGAGNPNPVQNDAFKRARVKQVQALPKCEAITRTTKARCRQPAMIGATRCRMHGGHYAAERAEAERMGRPIVRLRNVTTRRLATLGSGPWPDGLPRRADLEALGPVARGRLFEAWLNREMAPDVWKREFERPRIRR